MLEELSLHILDIGMNSLAAGAKNLEIIVIENTVRDWLIIRIRDDGRGMDENTLNQVLGQNLTSKKGRKKPIGLGLAFLRQTSEMCGGTFHVRSTPGRGTSVTASMRLSHIDRPPLGDLNSTIIALCANPDVGVQLHYRSNNETFHFSSKEGKSNEPRRTQETQGKGSTSSRAA
ncbi:MAG TPA: ATP-binding protein [Verrucomicrobiae bacterium]|nr:ATP-binding protein [Verrucomicrobiae bacterium]